MSKMTKNIKPESKNKMTISHPIRNIYCQKKTKVENKWWNKSILEDSFLFSLF